MLTGPILTDIDARAKVKGSRDPLGVQGMWIQFGRRVSNPGPIVEGDV